MVVRAMLHVSWFAWVFLAWHLLPGSITTFGCLEEGETLTEFGLPSFSDITGSYGISLFAS